MPEISRFYGIVITMFVSEHNPPHFHVEYQGFRAMITIEEGIVVGSLPRRILALVFEWLDLHKNELLENWKRVETNQILRKIEPLK